MNYSPYEIYKPSGVELLGKIPEHWKVKKAKYCCRLNMGQSPTSEECNVDGEGLPFLQGCAEFGAISPNPRQYCATARKVAVKGDILISVRAPVGALNITDQNYGIGRGVCSVRPRPDSIDLTFCWYLIHEMRSQLSFHATGSTYEAVAAEDVGNIHFVLPSLDEQRAIAAFLDREMERIDGLIEKKERQVELLQEKRTALISHAVTKGLNPDVKMKPSGIEWLGEIPEHWKVYTLRRVAKRIQTGSTPPTAQDHYYENTSVPWYGPGSFAVDLLLNNPVKFIAEEAVRDGVARLFAKGSAFIVTIGATIGKVGYTDRDASCNQQITVVTFDDRMAIGKFGAYQLKRLEPILQGIAPSTTLPIMNQQQVGAMPIVLPNIEEQKVIITHIDVEARKIDTLIRKIQESIEKLREYRTALISAAVTGKIDVRKKPQ